MVLRENKSNIYAKFWRDKQRVLWYFWKWPIGYWQKSWLHTSKCVEIFKWSASTTGTVIITSVILSIWIKFMTFHSFATQNLPSSWGSRVFKTSSKKSVRFRMIVGTARLVCLEAAILIFLLIASWIIRKRSTARLLWLKKIIWVIGVLRRTPTQMIFFNQGMLLLGSNHFLKHDYFSLFNQSDHRFLALCLPLPLSLLKLHVILQNTSRKWSKTHAARVARLFVPSTPIDSLYFGIPVFVAVFSCCSKFRGCPILWLNEIHDYVWYTSQSVP